MRNMFINTAWLRAHAVQWGQTLSDLALRVLIFFIMLINLSIWLSFKLSFIYFVVIPIITACFNIMEAPSYIDDYSVLMLAPLPFIFKPGTMPHWIISRAFIKDIINELEADSLASDQMLSFIQASLNNFETLFTITDYDIEYLEEKGYNKYTFHISNNGYYTNQFDNDYTIFNDAGLLSE